MQQMHHLKTSYFLVIINEQASSPTATELPLEQMEMAAMTPETLFSLGWQGQAY